MIAPRTATLTLDVDLDGTLPIGPGAEGNRGVAFINGGRFEGQGIAATVLGGEDWFVQRPDGSLAIDVRLTLHTDDDAFMTLAYTGELGGSPEALAAFARRQPMRPGAYSLKTTAVTQCGGEAYRWLDGARWSGVGEQTPAGPVYLLTLTEGAGA